MRRAAGTETRRFSPLGLKENEANARERLRAFLAGASLGDRPALWVVADIEEGSSPPPARTRPVRGPDLERKAADLDPAWHIERIDRALGNTAFLAEAMPTATIMVGTDITNTAVLLGGDYDYLYGEAIIRRDPGVLEAAPPAFDPQHPLVRRLETVYRSVAEHVCRRAFVNTVMTLDALTAMSQLLGPWDFCLKLLRRSDWVAGRALAITQLNVAFYRHFHALLVSLGHGESSGWFHTMAEGRFDCLRADCSVMISPDMFERFAVPQLRLQSESLDRCLFNMDSVRMLRFLDSIASIPSLDGIYWNPERQNRDLRGWIDALCAIRARGLLLEITAASVEEACFAARTLGPDGLLISLPRFSSREEGLIAIERIGRACAATPSRKRSRSGAM